MALEQDASSRSQNVHVSCSKKRLAHLVHCTESRIMLKTGQQEKLYPPTDISVSQQCRPQLLSVKFENSVLSIFRNENSTLEINVSHFGVLHWQQWQPPASAPNKNIRQLNVIALHKMNSYITTKMHCSLKCKNSR